MLRLDVPKFDVVLTKASVDAIHENMSGMDEAFIQKQTDIIRFKAVPFLSVKAISAVTGIIKTALR